jgi:hypothetical protein
VGIKELGFFRFRNRGFLESELGILDLETPAGFRGWGTTLFCSLNFVLLDIGLRVLGFGILKHNKVLEYRNRSVRCHSCVFFYYKQRLYK